MTDAALLKDDLSDMIQEFLENVLDVEGGLAHQAAKRAADGAIASLMDDGLLDEDIAG